MLSRRLRTIATVMGATIVTAACKTDIGADLYTADLVATTQGETLTAPVTIGIKASTEAKCIGEADQMIGPIHAQYPDVSFIGCVRRDFDVVAQFRVQASLIHLTSSEWKMDDALAIGVATNGESFRAYFLVDHSSVKEIWDNLPEEMTRYQNFYFEPIFEASITNDLRSTIKIETDDVFADGIPIQGTSERDMPRRDQITIRLSNVSNTAVRVGARSTSIATFFIDE